jgi:hypothetical protein
MGKCRFLSQGFNTQSKDDRALGQNPPTPKPAVAGPPRMPITALSYKSALAGFEFGITGPGRAVLPVSAICQVPSALSPGLPLRRNSGLESPTCTC